VLCGGASQAVVDYTLVRGVETQMQLFMEAFTEVLDPQPLQLFTRGEVRATHNRAG
jgi:hypothetical protein